MLAQERTGRLTRYCFFFFFVFAIKASGFASSGETQQRARTISVKTSGGNFDVNFHVVSERRNAIDPLAKIDSDQPCFFIIHGFMDTAGTAGNDYQPAPWMLKIAAAIRSGKAVRSGPSANIILVDWSPGSGDSLADYFQVVHNVQPVGEAIASFITKSNLDASKAILIGHSLGGHIAGAAGTKIKVVGPRHQLRAIIGIDEAGIGFETAKAERTLDASDASIVISIKTSAWCGNQRHLATTSLYINPIRSESGRLIGYHHPGAKPTFRDLSKLNIEADRQSHFYGREEFVPALLRNQESFVAAGPAKPISFKSLLSTRHGTYDVNVKIRPQSNPRKQRLEHAVYGKPQRSMQNDSVAHTKHEKETTLARN